LELSERNDPIARPIVESAGKSLGAAIAQLVNVLDPEAVVIGGGLGLAGGLYRCSVEKALQEYVWSEIHRKIRLVSATLGNDAGIVGAALCLGNSSPSPGPLPKAEGS
jgi:glucokinase